MTHADVEQLFRKYGPAVLRRARALLGDEHAARDALQEVFVRVLRHGAEFRREASPMTWLYRVTTNHCLNLIRDHGRRAQLLAENAPPADEGRRLSAEERLTLAQMLARVPEELRAIAIYHYVDQMSHDEIAEIVGVSRRTIGNRLDEFRRLIQAPLKEAS